ncbi:MAG: hypothetical protein WBB23_13585 [Desulforhopalus sp.]
MNLQIGKLKVNAYGIVEKAATDRGFSETTENNYCCCPVTFVM